MAGIKLPTITDEPGIIHVSPGPTVVMLCGLQGSGKTTTAGKLAAYLKKRGRSVMLAAADLQRPAAVEQLETVARHVQEEMPGGAAVQFYSEPDKTAEYGKAVGVAVGVCQRAVAAAQRAGLDTVILDTAGRLHVNDELMGELQAVNRMLRPHQILLVVDAMTGQDAVNSAKAFHSKLEVDGIILTEVRFGYARRRSDIGQECDGGRRSSSSVWARSWMRSRSFMRSGWRGGFSAWATWCRWSRRLRSR
jgi:signal recognition particle subunit SRP54